MSTSLVNLHLHIISAFTCLHLKITDISTIIQSVLSYFFFFHFCTLLRNKCISTITQSVLSFLSFFLLLELDFVQTDPFLPPLGKDSERRKDCSYDGSSMWKVHCIDFLFHISISLSS